MAEESGSSNGIGQELLKVFNKTVKTVTFNNGYKNDGSDSGFKTLNAAAVPSTAAMAAMQDGNVQNYLKGNVISHYTGDRRAFIDANDILVVLQQQTETITEDVKHIYLADYLHAVKGNEDIRVNQTRTIIVLGTSEENYVGTHEVTAPEEFEWKSFERGFSFTKMDLMGFGLDVHAVQVEAFGANVEAGLDTAEGALFHQEMKLHHEKESPLIVRMGIEADVLLRGDVLIDIGTGTPFR